MKTAILALLAGLQAFAADDVLIPSPADSSCADEYLHAIMEREGPPRTIGALGGFSLMESLVVATAAPGMILADLYMANVTGYVMMAVAVGAIAAEVAGNAATAKYAKVAEAIGESNSDPGRQLGKLIGYFRENIGPGTQLPSEEDLAALIVRLDQNQVFCPDGEDPMPYKEFRKTLLAEWEESD